MINLSSLNAAQLEAVQRTEGPLLVLAGAGSGKTRVLTCRIAHLVQDKNVAPYQILAITFTNKAAVEMRERLTELVAGTDDASGLRTRDARGGMAGGMWVMTFHAMCVRILRAHAEKLGYTSNFTIYDEADSKRLAKEVMAELNIDEKHYSLNGVRAKISDAKNTLVSAADYAQHVGVSNPFLKMVGQVYELMQERLRQNNAMDFDDLLVNVVRLFRTHPEVLATYQKRFHYIHVDEYQDTNKAQYEIVTMLAREHRNLMVVGDDDQSIYSWRGADIRNILEFERDYPDAHIVKLEENYRSTSTILQAANAVIAHNEMRKPKELFTSGAAGDPVAVYLATNEHDEARYIAGQIEQLARTENRCLSDFAVFYRTNAQSRVLEDAFLRVGLPYRIVGGTRYFDRAEIRDLMAYLKVIVNPLDEISLKRIINTPRRGIGNMTLSTIEKAARDGGVSLETALKQLAAANEIRSAGALRDFGDMLTEMRALQGHLKDVVDIIIDRSGLLAAYERERTDEAASRAENIREFLNVAAEFAQTHDDNSLFAFMEWLALRSDLDALTAADDAATLMTVHAAKGLEFPVVFVAGMEESIFPHMMSMQMLGDNGGAIEEERRLAYVAITRAREVLHLTYATSRSAYGEVKANPMSRFIGEIPDELIARTGVGSSGFEGTVFGGGGSGSVVKRSHKVDMVVFEVGDAVVHKAFGRGIVRAVEGDSLSVEFDGPAGTKNLLKGYAPLTKIV